MMNSVLWRSRISCCILIFSFLSMYLMFPSTKAVGQAFSLFGCFDGDASCDWSPPGDNIVNVVNLDTGQGFSLTGELTYYPHASPGGGIATQLSPVAGVRFTNASITYDATNLVPAIHEELDLIYFEFPSPLTLSASYRTIGSYDGSFNNTAAPGNRVFSFRTVANGGLADINTVSGTGASTANVPLGPHLMSGAHARNAANYSPPVSGTENIFVIPVISAMPGDVFTFPTSIEVGVFAVPEPSSIVLTSFCISSMFCTRRRKK